MDRENFLTSNPVRWDAGRSADEAITSGFAKHHQVGWMDATRRGPGRPRKPPAKLRRATIKFRVTDRLRDRLAAAAAAEGRPISEEVEYRLARTFRDDLLLGEGLHLRLICQDVSNALRMLEMVTGRRAFGRDGDRWMHEQVENAFADWFDRTRPKGERRVPDAIAALDGDPQFAAFAVAAVFGDLVAELGAAPANGDQWVGPIPCYAAADERLKELLREILRILSTRKVNDD
jgi:hypothetical protein